MTLEQKVNAIAVSLYDYLTPEDHANVDFEIRCYSVVISYYKVVLFEFSQREIKPSLIDTYAYIIARIIHSHKAIANRLSGKL